MAALTEASSVDVNPLVVLQPLGDLPPFFCVHGIGGNVLDLQCFATHMGTNRPIIGFHQTANTCIYDSIGEMAKHYVTAMLVHQPTGPFYLGGASFGATVAYEMALQLLQNGHEVGLLAVIDQRRPGWRLTARNAIPALPRILANVPHRIRGELSHIPAADRPRQLRRILLRWSKLALGQHADVTLMFDLRDQKQILLHEANLRALRDYCPAPLSAPIILFRASDQLLSFFALDSALGWKDLALNGIKIRTIPGNHSTIIAEPFVRELAKKLADDLDAAQGIH